MPQLKAKDFLLDPRFHGLDREVRRSLLTDVWPEFAQSQKADQEATLDQPMAEWEKVIKTATTGGAEKPKSRWEQIKGFFGGLEPPPGTESKMAPVGPGGTIALSDKDIAPAQPAPAPVAKPKAAFTPWQPTTPDEIAAEQKRVEAKYAQQGAPKAVSSLEPPPLPETFMSASTAGPTAAEVEPASRTEVAESLRQKNEREGISEFKVPLAERVMATIGKGVSKGITPFGSLMEGGADDSFYGSQWVELAAESAAAVPMWSGWLGPGVTQLLGATAKAPIVSKYLGQIDKLAKTAETVGDMRKSGFNPEALVSAYKSLGEELPAYIKTLDFVTKHPKLTTAITKGAEQGYHALHNALAMSAASAMGSVARGEDPTTAITHSFEIALLGQAASNIPGINKIMDKVNSTITSGQLESFSKELINAKTAGKITEAEASMAWREFADVVKQASDARSQIGAAIHGATTFGAASAGLTFAQTEGDLTHRLKMAGEEGLRTFVAVGAMGFPSLGMSIKTLTGKTPTQAEILEWYVKAKPEERAKVVDELSPEDKAKAVENFNALIPQQKQLTAGTPPPEQKLLGAGERMGLGETGEGGVRLGEGGAVKTIIETDPETGEKRLTKLQLPRLPMAGEGEPGPIKTETVQKDIVGETPIQPAEVGAGSAGPDKILTAEEIEGLFRKQREAEAADIEKELPLTSRDLELMQERMDLFKQGLLKLPPIQAAQEKVTPENIDELVQLAFDRGDFAWLRDVRQRLGVGPEAPDPNKPKPKLLEPGVDPKAVQEGLDRLRLLREDKLAPPPEAQPEREAQAKRDLERTRMQQEGRLSKPESERKGLPPPPEFAYEEKAPGAIPQGPRRTARLVPGQGAFAFKSETGAQRLLGPPGAEQEDPAQFAQRMKAEKANRTRVEEEVKTLSGEESRQVSEEYDAFEKEVRDRYQQEKAALEEKLEPIDRQASLAAIMGEVEAYKKYERDARLMMTQFENPVPPAVMERIDSFVQRRQASLDKAMKERGDLDPLETAQFYRDKARAFHYALREESSYGGFFSPRSAADNPKAAELKQEINTRMLFLRDELDAASNLEETIDKDIRDGIRAEMAAAKDRRETALDEKMAWRDARIQEIDAEAEKRVNEADQKFKENIDALMRAMKVVPTYFSRLEQGIISSPQKVFSPEQADALVRKSTSPDELEYTGILDFIAEKKKSGEKVTKQELQDRVRESKLKTDEVVWEEEGGGYRQYSEKGGRDYRELVVHEEADTRKLSSFEANLNKRGISQLADNSYIVLDPTGAIKAKVDEIQDMRWGKQRGARKALVNRFQKLLFGGRTTLTRQMGLAFEGPPVEVTGAQRIREGVKALRFRYDGRFVKEYDSAGDALADLLTGEDGDAMLADWHDGHPHYNSVNNPIVRLRFKTRRTTDGKDIMFLEEIQAPHGDPYFVVNGKKFDYAPEAKIEALKLTEEKRKEKGDKFDPKTDTVKMERKYGGEFGKMPKWAQNRWMDIGIKRAIRWAAENGLDGVSWTTGEMQAKRYSLDRQVDEISYDPKTGRLTATKDDRARFDQVVDETKLSSYVGPELARELMKQADEYRNSNGEIPLPKLAGDDLKMSLTGLIDIYDNMLPKAAVEASKRYGVKIEPVEAIFEDDAMVQPRQGTYAKNPDKFVIYRPSEYENYKDLDGNDMLFDSAEEAQAVIDHQLSKRTQVMQLAISPELRAGAMRQGFALMSETGARRTSKVDEEVSKQVEQQGMEEFVGKPTATPPKKTVKAYKLFRVDPDQPGRLFPLFVYANDGVPVGEWTEAVVGPMAKSSGKVKSRIGELAMRPGWHSSDLPVATHIGGKSVPNAARPDYRPSDQVWAEVEVPADINWQAEANRRGVNAEGKIVPSKAHITDKVPSGGFYKYKTNPNMTGSWLISGSMKVNRILTDAEVQAINKKAGVRDLPRQKGAKPVVWLEPPPGAGLKKTFGQLTERATISPAKEFGLPEIEFSQPESADHFINARGESKRAPYLGSQTAVELEAEGARLYMTKGGQVGYGITADGELMNLFNNNGPMGSGTAALLDGVKRGAYWLECFDGKLPRIYTKAGFEAVARIPFNDEYAPAGWNFERDGRPDLVFMAWKGSDYGRPEESFDPEKRYVPGSGERLGGFDEAKALARSAANPGWDVAAGRAGIGGELRGRGTAEVPGELGLVGGGAEGIRGTLEPSERVAVNLDRAAEAEDVRASLHAEGRPVPAGTRPWDAANAAPAGGAGGGGLEAPVPVGGEKPSELLRPPTDTGGGGPEQLLSPGMAMSMRLQIRQDEPRLKPGQTKAGRKAARSIDDSPKVEHNGKDYDVHDASGDIDRALMLWVADHKFTPRLVEHFQKVFDRVAEAMSGGDSTSEYLKTVFRGLSLDPTCYGVFYPGVEGWGRGHENIVHLNPISALSAALKDVASGDIRPEDVPRELAANLIDTVFHEMVHTVERNETLEGHRKKLGEALDTHSDLKTALTENLRKFLAYGEDSPMKHLQEIHDEWAQTVAPFYAKNTFAETGLGLFKRVPVEPTEEHYQAVGDIIMKDGLFNEGKAYEKFKEAYPDAHKADFKAIWKGGMEYTAKLIDGLTEPELARVSKDAASIKGISDDIDSLPPETDLESLARMGEVKRGWYYRAVRACRALADMVDPNDRVPLVRILAATSPRQSVKENMIMALETYNEWVRRGRPGAEVPEEEFYKWVPDFAPMDSRYKNAVRAMRGEAFSDKSYKVASFADNMVDDILQSTDAVTNDTHMNKLAPPEYKLGNYTSYYAMAAKTRRVAKNLGWTPREVQESIWSVMKTIWEIAETKGETRKPTEILQTITQQDIIEHGTEFSVLLTQDKDVHNALAKLGVNSKTLRNKIIKYGGKYEPPETRRFEETRPSLSGGLVQRLDRAFELTQAKKREAVERRRYAKEVTDQLKAEGVPEEEIKDKVVAAVQARFGRAARGEKDIPSPEEMTTLQPIEEGLEPPPTDAEAELAAERAAIQGEGEEYPDFGFKATGPAAITRLPQPPGGGAPSTTPDLDDARKVFEKRPEPPGPGFKERMKNFAHEAERRWITEFAPVAHLETKVRGAAKPYTENMATWMEAVYGASAMAERDLMDLENVVEPIKKNMPDFDTFMFLRRTQDRLQEDPNQRRVGSWDLPKVQRAFAQMRQELGTNTVDEFYKIADHYIDQNGNFVEGPYQKIMDKALRLMVDSGRMSQDVYNQIKAKNDFYAPFAVLQYLDPASQTGDQPMSGAGRKIATRADLTYAIKGIDDPDFRIDSILAASAQQIYRARILAEKNKAMLKLSELAPLDPNGENIKFVKGPVYLPPGAPGEKGRWILPGGESLPKNKEVLPFKKDGDNVALIVDKDVATAVQGMNRMQGEILSSLLRKTMAPARWGATTFNLAFQPVNYLFADMPRLATMSKYGVQNPVDAIRYITDFMSGTVSAFRGTFGHADMLYKAALEMGVLNSTIQKVLTPEIFAEKYNLDANAKKGFWKGAKRLTIDNFAKFANALEESTKVTGVKRALRLEGYDQLTGTAKAEAANRIRTELRRYSGSPDFARAGVDARTANLWFMFINARLQGTHSDMARLLGKTGGKDAASSWARLTALMLPMLGVALLNRADDELAKDYAQVPSWEKDNYFMVPMNSRFVNDQGISVRNYARIPKREIFKMAGNLVDSLVGFMADKDQPSIAKVADEFLGNISPVNIQGDTAREKAEAVVGGTNPLIKTPAEWIFNRDMFRHRDVVPQGLKDLPAEMQYKRTTPQVYVELGNLTGFSPLRIQQATSGISAGLITQFTMGKPSGDRGWYSELPVVKRFVRSDIASTEAEDARLQEAITANQTDSAIKKQLAEHLYDTVKDKPKETQRALVAKVSREAKDPLLAQTLKQIIIDAGRGLTFQDRQMMRLGVQTGARAAYIQGALDRLPNDQARQEWIKDLRKKKILTGKVMGQLRRGKQPMRRTQGGGLEPPPE